MKQLKQWLQNKLENRPILRNILVLFTGTAFAQMISMLIAVFTARIFTTEQFGQFAIYGSITAVFIAIASLRFDMTIVLPETDEEAKVIGRLATRANIITAIGATLLALFLHDFVVKIWGDETLAKWLPFSGLTIFFVAQVTVLQYWYNRKGRYTIISKNRVEQTIGSSGGQLFMGAIGVRSMFGLLIGTLFGQAYAYFNLNRKAKDFREPLSKNAPSIGEMARKYKKMPLLNLPNALIDSVRLNGIVMLIGTIAVGIVGQFNLAWRILQVPIGLINGAVAQVFYRELAQVKPGSMRSLIRKTIVRALALSIPPFALIYIFSPWLFTFIFGAQWNLAGDIAQSLTPWLAMQLVTSPISTIFVVTSKQHWMLIFSIVFCVVPLSWLYYSPLEFISTLTWLGLIMAALLIVMLIMADIAAEKYDRGQ